LIAHLDVFSREWGKVWSLCKIDGIREVATHNPDTHAVRDGKRR
jgi:hypothetical protein